MFPRVKGYQNGDPRLSAVTGRWGEGATYAPTEGQAGVYDIMRDGQRVGQATDYWFNSRPDPAPTPPAGVENRYDPEGNYVGQQVTGHTPTQPQQPGMVSAQQAEVLRRLGHDIPDDRIIGYQPPAEEAAPEAPAEEAPAPAEEAPAAEAAPAPATEPAPAPVATPAPAPAPMNPAAPKGRSGGRKALAKLEDSVKDAFKGAEIDARFGFGSGPHGVRIQNNLGSGPSISYSRQLGGGRGDSGYRDREAERMLALQRGPSGGSGLGGQAFGAGYGKGDEVASFDPYSDLYGGSGPVSYADAVAAQGRMDGGMIHGYSLGIPGVVGQIAGGLAGSEAAGAQATDLLSGGGAEALTGAADPTGGAAKAGLDFLQTGEVSGQGAGQLLGTAFGGPLGGAIGGAIGGALFKDGTEKVDGSAAFKQYLAANPPRPMPRAPSPLAALAGRAAPHFPSQQTRHTIQQTPTPGQGGRYRGY